MLRIFDCSGISSLLSLFCVKSLDQLPDVDEESVKNNVQRLFRTTGATDYDGFCKAFALYYLPVNFYKIWRPLLDLVLTDSLPVRGRILELGTGPGSATFGLIEFYKCLAAENIAPSFSLDIVLVEKSDGFNYSRTSVETAFEKHDPRSPLLVGDIGPNDKITERKVKSRSANRS